jgi:hypothetical protein
MGCTASGYGLIDYIATPLLLGDESTANPESIFSLPGAREGLRVDETQRN